VSPAPALIANRYRLQSRIAGGGMGEVWRAVDELLDRPVAVKLLRREYTSHAETLSRFAAEARHAASVTHPGIAQVYDYGATSRRGSPYLVMELVDGPSLDAVLARGPLDAARAMDVIAQAAAGLAAAHQAALVHRDIKPANLLLGRDGTVKITDFGIAYAAGSAPITQTGVLMGTAAYMAPERTVGGPATPASDLYSLGIAGHECLTGTPPFVGTAMDVAFAHQHRPLPPLPPGVPAEVTALIGELAAKDPAARPASADEVAARAADLRNALASAAPLTSLPPIRGQAAVPPTAPERQARPDGTRGYTRAGFPAAPPGTPAAPGQRAPAAPGHRAPAGRARPRNRILLAASGAAVIAGLAIWLTAARSGAPASTPSRQPAATRSATARPSTAVRTVDVNEGALAGQPVGPVVRELRRLGLRPEVTYVTTTQQPPGAVLSVQPAGPLPPGSTVTVTAAQRPAAPRAAPTPAGPGQGPPPPGHGNGKGHGKGPGGG
jgi:serine/threonine-protein kinase